MKGSSLSGYLARSYWSAGIPREIVKRSLANSLCLGVYDAEIQVGFARVITDYATFAVFIIEFRRGRNLAGLLMECIIQHPQLQGLRRWPTEVIRQSARRIEWALGGILPGHVVGESRTRSAARVPSIDLAA